MADDAPSEIRLSEIKAAVLQHKRVLIGVPVVCFVLAVLFLHVADRTFTIELRVTPTVSANSTLPSGIGGLASLAGISIPGGGESSAFDLYLESLKSRETAAFIAANQNLLRLIFPAEWDEEAIQWVRPAGFVPTGIRLAKQLLGVAYGSWMQPDAARVNEYLDQEISVIRDRNSPVVTITMDHRNPETARQLLAEMHAYVDAALRKKELDRTTAYIEYLNDQLAKVSVSEYRQSLHDIIAEQEKRRMVASSNLPFAAEPFGGPTVSPRPTSPKPVAILIMACFLGGIFGLLGALGMHQFRISRPHEL